jgi:hypothetical protein
MIIFIDESGDAGFKLGKGSSSVFVISMVIFDDPLVAEETALSIKKLRRDLRFSDNYELKFNKLKKSYRIAFLENVKKFKFRVRSIVFKKEILYSRKLREDKNSFYGYAVKSLLKHNNNSIHAAKIRIDGLGERSFKRNLNAYLRKELNINQKYILKNLKFVDSKENVLIQLADIVSGAIRRSYDKDKNDSFIYREILEVFGRLEDTWEFK